MAEMAPGWMEASSHRLLYLIPELHKHGKAIIRIKSIGIWANTTSFFRGNLYLGSLSAFSEGLTQRVSRRGSNLLQKVLLTTFLTKTPK